MNTIVLQAMHTTSSPTRLKFNLFRRFRQRFYDIDRACLLLKFCITAESIIDFTIKNQTIFEWFAISFAFQVCQETSESGIKWINNLMCFVHLALKKIRLIQIKNYQLISQNTYESLFGKLCPATLLALIVTPRDSATRNRRREMD